MRWAKSVIQALDLHDLHRDLAAIGGLELRLAPNLQAHDCLTERRVLRVHLNVDQIGLLARANEEALFFAGDRGRDDVSGGYNVSARAARTRERFRGDG